MDYLGNGCTLAYAYTFKIPTTSDLDVFVGGVQKTLTADYTVSGADVATGGTVTFTVAPGCNLAIAIIRDVAYTQATAYPENSPFPAASHEDALDKGVMLVQQVKELATRSWRFAAGRIRAAAGYVVDEPGGGKYPRVKSDCSGIEFVALENCGTYANPVTTLGDLIQGSTTGVQERLAISTSLGDVLHTGCGSKARWAPALSLVLTNKLDTQADAGALFALSTTCDKAFVTGDDLGCRRLYVVASSAVSDDCAGLMLLAGGPIRVRSQGTIARGDYLRKSATAGAVETTCVNMTAHRPMPGGTLGIAASVAAGDCVEMIKFPTTTHGHYGLRGVRGNRSLRLKQETMQLVADRVLLGDSCDELVIIRKPAAITNDITVDNTNQDNGRDQFAAFSAGWIHFYWTYKGDCGKLVSRSSTKAPPDGPELPACETHWAYSHPAYYDGSCLHKVRVLGETIFYDCARTVLSAGTATCETKVELQTSTPPNANETLLYIYHNSNSTATRPLSISHLEACTHLFLAEANAAFSSQYVRLPNVKQQLFYRFLDLATGGVTLDVGGYTIESGG